MAGLDPAIQSARVGAPEESLFCWMAASAGGHDEMGEGSQE
jgi:hypothetical protein